MIRYSRVLVAAVLASFVLAGCGGTSSDEGSGTIKIGVLWEIGGESPVAVNYFQYGAETAVEEINAAGGIDGREVELIRESADPFDPQASIASYQKLMDKSPDALIGFPATGQAQAIQRELDRDGIPFIGISGNGAALGYGAKGVSKYYWSMQTSTSALAAAATSYAVGELKLKTIGLMGTSEAFGTTAVESSKEDLADNGLKPYAVRQYDATATDLTEQVLAMKGAQAVFDWGYPNTVSVQLKQFLQNGMKIPTFYHSGSQAIVNGKLAPPKALANLYGVMGCEPRAAEEGTPLATYAKEYQETYDEAPTSAGTETHDAVYLLKAAIEKAGSTDHDAVNDAIGEVELDADDGVLCAPSYRAGDDHFMEHQVQIIDYAGDGSAKLVGTHDVAD